MSDIAATIAANVARVLERIAAAARRSRRTADDVRLVAVTKYVVAELARATFAAGCCELGESRQQELSAKAAALADVDVSWHLIGPLQRNKIRRLLPLVKLIHSVDSTRLLDAINRIATEQGIVSHVLIEVNTSGDLSKSGLPPAEVAPLIASAVSWPHVSIDGLMTMAALAGGEDVARRNFAELRELRNKITTHCPGGVALTELSMGMSGDFEVAIEEGATIVRVGSALFEGITSP